MVNFKTQLEYKQFYITDIGRFSLPAAIEAVRKYAPAAEGSDSLSQLLEQYPYTDLYATRVSISIREGARYDLAEEHLPDYEGNAALEPVLHAAIQGLEPFVEKWFSNYPQHPKFVVPSMSASGSIVIDMKQGQGRISETIQYHISLIYDESLPANGITPLEEYYLPHDTIEYVLIPDESDEIGLDAFSAFVDTLDFSDLD